MLIALLATAELKANAQNMQIRGITQITNNSIKLPSQTLIGISLEPTPEMGLVETGTSLLRQRIEIPITPSTKSVIDTYSRVVTRETVLYDPLTYSNSNPGTTVGDQGPSYSFPDTCGALTRIAPTGGDSATYTYPVVPGTLPAQSTYGDGYWLGDGADTAALPDRTVAVGFGNNDPAYICPQSPAASVPVLLPVLPAPSSF
jgi:hypothetical protein